VAETLRQWATSDERIAIVTHGDFSNGLLHALFNLAPERGVYYHHPNTAISRIDFQGDGRLDVRYVSRVDHLPPELIS
jgi:broad specificity phosphatase PhoE